MFMRFNKNQHIVFHACIRNTLASKKLKQPEKDNLFSKEILNQNDAIGNVFINVVDKRALLRLNHPDNGLLAGTVGNSMRGVNLNSQFLAKIKTSRTEV